MRFSATRRQIARADREGRGQSRCRPGRDDRDLRDHDHPARRARARGRQRSARQPVGPVHHRVHDPDRPAHGRLDELHPAGEGRRGHSDGNRAAVCRAHGRPVDLPESRVGAGLHVVGHEPHMGSGHLRLRRVGPAGLAAPGAARLPVGVHENRHDTRAGRGDPARASAAAHAGRDPVHRRDGSGLRGQAVSVCVHHDCVRRNLGVPRARFERHDAEDDSP